MSSMFKAVNAFIKIFKYGCLEVEWSFGADFVMDFVLSWAQPFHLLLSIIISQVDL